MFIFAFVAWKILNEGLTVQEEQDQGALLSPLVVFLLCLVFLTPKESVSITVAPSKLVSLWSPGKVLTGTALGISLGRNTSLCLILSVWKKGSTQPSSSLQQYLQSRLGTFSYCLLPGYYFAGAQASLVLDHTLEKASSVATGLESLLGWPLPGLLGLGCEEVCVRENSVEIQWVKSAMKNPILRRFFEERRERKKLSVAKWAPSNLSLPPDLSLCREERVLHALWVRRMCPRLVVLFSLGTRVRNRTWAGDQRRLRLIGENLLF